MGAAQAKNVTDSYANALTQQQSSIQNNASTENIITNYKEFSNISCGEDVTIDVSEHRDIGVKVSTASYQKAMTNSSASQSVAQDVSASAAAVCKGLNLAQTSSAEVAATSVVDSTISLNNAIGNNCNNSTDVSNILIITDVEAKGDCTITDSSVDGVTVNSLTNCKQVAQITAATQNSVSQTVATSAVAKTEGMPFWILALLGIAAAVIAIVAGGTGTVGAVYAGTKAAPWVVLAVGIISISTAIGVMGLGASIKMPASASELSKPYVRTYPFAQLDEISKWTSACGDPVVANDIHDEIVEKLGTNRVTHEALHAEFTKMLKNKDNNVVAYEWDGRSGEDGEDLGTFKIYKDNDEDDGLYDTNIKDEQGRRNCTGMPAEYTCGPFGSWKPCNDDSDCSSGVKCLWYKGQGPMKDPVCGGNTGLKCDDFRVNIRYAYPETYLSTRAPKGSDETGAGMHVWIDVTQGSVYTRVNTDMHAGAWNKSLGDADGAIKAAVKTLSDGAKDKNVKNAFKHIGYGFTSPEPDDDHMGRCRFRNLIARNDATDEYKADYNNFVGKDTRITATSCGKGEEFNSDLKSLHDGQPVMCDMMEEADGKDDLLVWLDMSDPNGWRLWEKLDGDKKFSKSGKWAASMSYGGAGCDVVTSIPPSMMTFVGLKDFEQPSELRKNFQTIGQYLYYALLWGWGARGAMLLGAGAVAIILALVLLRRGGAASAAAKSAANTAKAAATNVASAAASAVAKK